MITIEKINMTKKRAIYITWYVEDADLFLYSYTILSSEKIEMAIPLAKDITSIIKGIAN